MNENPRRLFQVSVNKPLTRDYRAPFIIAVAYGLVTTGLAFSQEDKPVFVNPTTGRVFAISVDAEAVPLDCSQKLTREGNDSGNSVSSGRRETRDGFISVMDGEINRIDGYKEVKKYVTATGIVHVWEEGGEGPKSPDETFHGEGKVTLKLSARPNIKKVGQNQRIILNASIEPAEPTPKFSGVAENTPDFQNDFKHKVAQDIQTLKQLKIDPNELQKELQKAANVPANQTPQPLRLPVKFTFCGTSGELPLIFKFRQTNLINFTLGD